MSNQLWHTNLSSGRLATIACLLELAAPKPGNVHRGADFEDVTLVDFMTSAVALGGAIDANLDRSLGATILAAVESTRTVARTNTNLGMILLIAPLAKCQGNSIDPGDVQQVLDQMDGRDGARVFEAIRMANPGGLGSRPEMDVRDEAAGEVDLLVAMQLAAERDRVAKQYTDGFAEIFGPISDALDEGRKYFQDLSQAIVFAHVKTMAMFPDTLIARKCGDKLALQAQTMAARTIDLLSEGQPSDDYWSAIADLDFWLRCDGNQRNPGTTADLIAAAIYVALRNGKLQPPF